MGIPLAQRVVEELSVERLYPRRQVIGRQPVRMQPGQCPAQLQGDLAAIAIPREHTFRVGVEPPGTHGAQLRKACGLLLPGAAGRLDDHVRIPRQQLLDRHRPQAALDGSRRIDAASRLDPLVDDGVCSVDQQLRFPLRDVQHARPLRLRDAATDATHLGQRLVQVLQIALRTFRRIVAQHLCRQHNAVAHRSKVLKDRLHHLDAGRLQLVGRRIGRREKGQRDVACQQGLGHEAPLRCMDGVMQRRRHLVHPGLLLRCIDGGRNALRGTQHHQHRGMRRPAIGDQRLRIGSGIGQQRHARRFRSRLAWRSFLGTCTVSPRRHRSGQQPPGRQLQQLATACTDCSHAGRDTCRPRRPAAFLHPAIDGWREPIFLPVLHTIPPVHETTPGSILTPAAASGTCRCSTR